MPRFVVLCSSGNEVEESDIWRLFLPRYPPGEKEVRPTRLEYQSKSNSLTTSALHIKLNSLTTSALRIKLNSLTTSALPH